MMNKFTKWLKNLSKVVDSHLDISYRIGLRVIKTGAAVMICLLITMITGTWESMAITAVSAIVTIRPTRGETLSTGVFRVIGTAFGGMLGIVTVIIGLFLPHYSDGLFVIVIPLMLLFDLYLCNVLKMQDSCTISCVVIIVVAAHIKLDATVSGALIYTLLRVRDTLIGVVVATIMNIVPYYISSFVKKKRGLTEAPGDETEET